MLVSGFNCVSIHSSDSERQSLSKLIKGLGGLRDRYTITATDTPRDNTSFKRRNAIVDLQGLGRTEAQAHGIDYQQKASETKLAFDTDQLISFGGGEDIGQ